MKLISVSVKITLDKACFKKWRGLGDIRKRRKIYKHIVTILCIK